jgi:hypothetical protein
VTESPARIIEPDLKRWTFAQREKALYESAATDIPTWRATNQARKYLAGVIADLANAMDGSADGPLPISGLDAKIAREVAAVNLGGIIVRGTSAIMSLVGCGHEREALSMTRITFEALIRGRQVADDRSGEVARKLLKGRSPGSLKSAAQKYGDKDDVEFLDRFAHADLIGLLVVMTPRPNAAEADLELLPQRGGVGPANQLLNAAHTAGMFSVVLADIFDVGVQLPPLPGGTAPALRREPAGKRRLRLIVAWPSDLVGPEP